MPTRCWFTSNNSTRAAYKIDATSACSLLFSAAGNAATSELAAIQFVEDTIGREDLAAGSRALAYVLKLHGGKFEGHHENELVRPRAMFAEAWNSPNRFRPERAAQRGALLIGIALVRRRFAVSFPSAVFFSPSTSFFAFARCRRSVCQSCNMHSRRPGARRAANNMKQTMMMLVGAVKCGCRRTHLPALADRRFPGVHGSGRSWV